MMKTGRKIWMIRCASFLGSLVLMVGSVWAMPGNTGFQWQSDPSSSPLVLVDDDQKENDDFVKDRSPKGAKKKKHKQKGKHGKGKPKAGKHKNYSPELKALLDRHHEEREALRARHKQELEVLKDRRQESLNSRQRHQDGDKKVHGKSHEGKASGKKGKKHKEQHMNRHHEDKEDLEHQSPDAESFESMTTP